MSGRIELRWLVFFALLLAALATAQAARGEEDARAAENPAPAATALPDPDAISATLAAGHKNYLEGLARHEEELASPEAVAERLRSRHAYADLNAAEAQQLAFSVFASTFEELDQDPARFLSDARLDKVVEADAATVTSEGDTQLLEAGMPVRAKDEDGDLGKVDLGIVRAEDGWKLENPLVEVEVGSSAEEGITLPEAGVTVVQAGAEDSASRPEGGSDLFFPEVEEGTDTDLIVSPVANGVELFDVLRSPASPETLRFQLQGPAGGELRMGPAGGAEIVVDGEVIVYVPKPWARDAQGTAVPIEMTVEGSSLVLAVDHRDQDLAYPVLVDPTIYQDWGWWYNGQNLQGLSAFYFQFSDEGTWAHGTYADPGGFPGYDGKGLFVWSDPGDLGADEWGQWVRTAPNGGSYLAAATINPFWRYDNPCNDPVRDYQPYDYQGMWNGQGGVGWNELRFNDAKNYGYTNLTTWGRALIFGLSTDWRGRESPCYRHLMAGGVGIWLDDWQSPTVSITALPTGWIKKDATARSLSVSAGDGGLGVQSVAMTAPLSASWNQPWCSGTYDNPCDGARSGTIGFTTSSLSEGPIGVTVQVSDPTAKKGSASGTVYVDGAAPTLNLSGSSTPTTYELQIDANDSASGVPRSGVKEVKVYLDGQLKQTKTGSCTTSGCGASLSFKYSQSLVGLSQGTHTVEVVAADQVGYTKSSQTTFKIEAPDTVIDSGPSGLTGQATPTFTYHSTLAGSSFRCRVDMGAWVGCPGTGYTTAKLAEGPHTFEVKATSGAGLEDTTPAKREFTVIGPPDTTITFGPEGATFATRPVFGYQSNNPRAWFECKLDSGAFEPCGPATFEALEGQLGEELTDGAHSVSVRAVNQMEVADPTPDVAAFTVDTGSPIAAVTSGPEGATNQSRPTFGLEASGTVTCFLEADSESEEATQDFEPCTTPSSYTPPSNLPDGGYALRLLAEDVALNETEDSREFTVDTTAPDTTITSAPPTITDNATPTIGFSSSEGASTFQCRFDAEAFRACSGPGAVDTPATALANGAHTFGVRAIDAAGNVDGTPATAAFTVLTSGPQTTIDSGPQGAIGSTEATFTYSTDETASMECKRDGGSFVSCPTTSKTYIGLGEGEHVFEVRGKNNATVADPTPARRTFVIDTSAPSTPVLSGPIFEEDGYGLDFTVEASDGDPSTAAGRRSGVESVQILLEGEVVMELEAECAAKVCPASFVRDAQIPWKPLLAAPAGASVQARAKDGLGHISTASLEIKLPHEHAVRATEGSGGAGAATFAAAASSGCDQHYEGKGNTVLVGSCDRDVFTKVPASVTVIKGRGGDDVLIAGENTKTIFGGDGEDVIRGGDGNDRLEGQSDADHIYGGNGDDKLFGGSQPDVLDGGPGADVDNGGPGNDTLRGGQGPDKLNGGPDDDTASYADALAPGFAEGETNDTPNQVGRPAKFKTAKQAAQADKMTQFPPADELGVYADLEARIVYGGDPAQGGGRDRINGTEYFVGSPFADWIEGAKAKKIDPGPGEDMLFDTGSVETDTEPGDWKDGTRVGAEYEPPKAELVKIGAYDAGVGKAVEKNVYVIGGNKGDFITAERTQAGVRVAAGGTSKPFKAGEGIGAIVLYGGQNIDTIKVKKADGTRPGTIELAGGPDADTLIGGPMEELLVDGIRQNAGTETLRGNGGEDDLAQSEGADRVEGGAGDDLFLNSRVCEGDLLYADTKDRRKPSDTEDNAQFHLLPNLAVYAEMRDGELGATGENQNVKYKLACDGGAAETLEGFNAFEGTKWGDVVKGNKNENYILGRGGENRMYGRGGSDRLVGYNENPEWVMDCGGGRDRAITDKWDRQYASRLHKTCEDLEPGKGFVYNDGRGKGFLNKEREKQAKGSASALAAPAFTSDPVPAGGDGETNFLAANLAEGFNGESAWPTAEFHLDETAGTSAANALDEEAPGTYMAKGLGPSVNGPGPVLGGENALLNVEETEEPEEEGASISLDGKTAYVDLHGQGGPEGGEEGYSVSLYVKFAAAPGQREYLFSSGGAGGRGAFLYRAPSGSIVFTTDLLFGGSTVVSEPVAAGEWHQVTASLEGETISLNVDGFPYELDYHSDVMPAPAPSPESLLGAGPGATDLLTGSIDEFISYAGVLSEGEIFPMLAASRAQVAEYLPVGAPEEDEDGDGVTDGLDNCPATSNPDQADGNLDRVGDACQVSDQDEDDIADASDNCPTTYNPAQADGNGDGLGDDCANLSPEVETGDATAVKATTATIGGTVYPEGQATNYYFEYGTTTAYGTKVPFFPKAAGAGFSPVTVNQALTGLAQGTTYHYRLVAQNAAGSQIGDDQTFVTLKAPKAMTWFAAGIGQSSATLYGGINPEGSATSYYFEYGTTTAYGTKIPASPKEVGSGAGEVTVNQPITGLTPGTTYHFRVVATSAAATTNGVDRTFTTQAGTVASNLSAMPVTDPFNATTNAVSNFATKWSVLGWAAGRGENRATGWGAVQAHPTINGAYFGPTVADVGTGAAAAATVAAGPGNNFPGRYLALWLDMQTPGGARSGYQLRFVQTSLDVYEVILAKWSAGAETVLATKTGYSLAAGSSIALVDGGSSVAAWTNTGSGFTQILTAADSSFSSGNGGVEASGNGSRLTNFKIGQLLPSVANMSAALEALRLDDAFATSELPLSGGGAWAALAWDYASPNRTGQVVAGEGWGPYDPWEVGEAINGAYWTKATFADTGSGDAVAATLKVRPGLPGRHFELLLNMPNPAAARSGYELRFTEPSGGTGTYTVNLVKWVTGTPTILASQANVSLAVGGRFALVHKAGVLSAWTAGATGEFTQLLSASDTTYQSGYLGIAGGGNFERLANFRGAQLPPF